VRIPTFPQAAPVLAYDSQYRGDLGCRKALRARNREIVQPNFELGAISLDMHVTRFLAIGGVEEEPVWAFPQNRRHLSRRF
jgi:hypothetical protein